jgi:hypothetical protein
MLPVDHALYNVPAVAIAKADEELRLYRESDSSSETDTTDPVGHGSPPRGAKAPEAAWRCEGDGTARKGTQSSQP